MEMVLNGTLKNFIKILLKKNNFILKTYLLNYRLNFYLNKKF